MSLKEDGLVSFETLFLVCLDTYVFVLHTKVSQIEVTTDSRDSFFLGRLALVRKPHLVRCTIVYLGKRKGAWA